MGGVAYLGFTNDYLKVGWPVSRHKKKKKIVKKNQEQYCDVFLTPHFEVQVETFSLAMETKSRGMGVLGFTQNILDFINRGWKRLWAQMWTANFRLGTESEIFYFNCMLPIHL